MPSTTALPRTPHPLEPVDDRTWSTTSPTGRIELRFPTGPAFVLDCDPHLGGTNRYVLPGDATGRTLSGRGTAWVLPTAVDSPAPAWLVRADGPLTVSFEDDVCLVVVEAATAELVRHRARPHADVHGDEFTLDLPGGEEFADAAAGFYWGTMLPCVVERTIAADYPDAEGFVISTLADTYLGTYPDVDHEFQVKGRLAWGSATDLDVVRRMLELQLRMMREDPQQSWRDPARCNRTATASTTCAATASTCARTP